MASSEQEWERRRRLARVFGDALPDTTSDERDESESPRDKGREPDRADTPGDRWLKEQVPPHHGG